MDWNNDGKKDLLTGENSGNIRIYLNTGMDANPVFSGYTYVMLGSQKYDAGSYSMVHVVDWNSDGKKDILCGESTGRVQLLLNRGSDANPVFNSMVYLKDGTGNLDAGSTVSPTVADWNRDGKKDLLVGESMGRVRYYENKGTDEAPVFNGGVFLDADGETLDVHYYARIDVADWDEDGVLDLMCGNRYYDGVPVGGVWFFHAQGPLTLSSNAISESTGGKIALDLRAGAVNGGRKYLILGSVSGTQPGTPLPGGMAVLPINWDYFTDAALPLVNTPVFLNFMGSLDVSGKAMATFNTLGPVSGSAGIMLSFAYALKGPYDYASNGANIEIVP